MLFTKHSSLARQLLILDASSKRGSDPQPSLANATKCILIGWGYRGEHVATTIRRKSVALEASRTVCRFILPHKYAPGGTTH